MGGRAPGMPPPRSTNGQCKDTFIRITTRQRSGMVMFSVLCVYLSTEGVFLYKALPSTPQYRVQTVGHLDKAPPTPNSLTRTCWN